MQCELFREVQGEQITELCVDALVRDDAELRAMASDLLVLVRYHANKAIERRATIEPAPDTLRSQADHEIRGAK